jgi:hypothetical protein
LEPTVPSQHCNQKIVNCHHYSFLYLPTVPSQHETRYERISVLNALKTMDKTEMKYQGLEINHR